MAKSKQGSAKDTKSLGKKADKSKSISSSGGKNTNTKSPGKKADFENPTDDPA